MITQTHKTALDPIQIAMAKPLEEFVAAIDLAFKRYSRSVAYEARESRIYAIALNADQELEPMTGREAKAANLPVVAYLDMSVGKRLLAREIMVTILLYDSSKEPTLMDRFERLTLHVTVPDESMRSSGCGTKLNGDDAMSAILRVLWEGAA